MPNHLLKIIFDQITKTSFVGLVGEFILLQTHTGRSLLLIQTFMEDIFYSSWLQRGDLGLILLLWFVLNGLAPPSNQLG